jgi:predicted DNA-binding WGR domain protein
MTTLELDNITLYYREGSSDKVYQCGIEPAGERFVVNFAYGRRGSTLNTGTKTNVPIDYDGARRIFEKLVHEKTTKGYTPGPDGTPPSKPRMNRASRGLRRNCSTHRRDRSSTAPVQRRLGHAGKVRWPSDAGAKAGAAIHGINRGSDRGLLARAVAAAIPATSS